MTPDELATIARLCDEASEGPWIAHKRSSSLFNVLSRAGCSHVADLVLENDAVFMAAAKQAVPRLLAHIQDLQDKLDENAQRDAGLMETRR